ncbi:MAG TPA: rod shape-determining protein MreD [Trebonia sp.]|nr:rod shape-determining protein MreD [Trebonia sp.]
MTGVLRRLLGPPVLLVVAIALQGTMFNRLPFPGNGQPDLVLLIVLALAAVGGPVPGMVFGFIGGLALDVAPPGSDLIGEKALIFCAAGYACGLFGAWQRKEEENLPPMAALPIVPICAAIAEALLAGLGRMLSDPSMTMPAIDHVLPAAIVYDIFLSPVAVLAVYAVRGGPKPAYTPFPPRKKGQAPGVAAVRAATSARVMAGSVPRLSFAGSRPDPLRSATPAVPSFRTSGTTLAPTFSGQGPSGSALRGASGGGLRPGALRSASGTALRGAGGSALRDAGGPRGQRWLRDSGPGGSSRGGGTVAGADSRTGPRANTGPAGGNWLRGHGRPGSLSSGRGDGAIGGSVLGGGLSLRSHGNGGFSGALGPSLFAGAGSRGPGRGWRRHKRGGLRLHQHSAAAATSASPRFGSGGTAGWGRSARGPGKGWLRTGGPGTGLGASGTNWSRRSQSSPGKGWLKPSKPVAYAPRRSPGRGWLTRKPPRIMFQRKHKGFGNKGMGGHR